ncbi:MAG: hypothetical protein KatS3mg103_0293 [Phycisphaerales bacterium]|nr:MAG: hypothetical protein KatS3mg103_0293 [Phycisphaerales bacterium]
MTIASTRPRSRCTRRRDAGPEIHRLSPERVAIRPSSVWAHLAITHGRPLRTRWQNGAETATASALASASADRHPRRTQRLRAASGLRVRIVHRVDHLADLRLEQRLDARRLPAVVGARLQRHEHPRPAHVVAQASGTLQGATLGVGLPEGPVRADAQHHPATLDHAADHRVGLDAAQAQQRQPSGHVQESLVLLVLHARAPGHSSSSKGGSSPSSGRT